MEAYSKFSPFCLLSILHSLQTVNTKKSRIFSAAPNKKFKEKENLKFSFMSQNILLKYLILCVCIVFSLSQILGILCTTIIWLSWDLLENLLKQISTSRSHSPHWYIFKCSTAQTYEVVLPHPMSCPFLLRIFTDEVGYYLWVSY